MYLLAERAYGAAVTMLTEARSYMLSLAGAEVDGTRLEDGYAEHYDREEAELSELLVNVHKMLVIIYQNLNLPTLIEPFTIQFQGLKSNLTEIKYIDGDPDFPYSLPISMLNGQLNFVKPLVNAPTDVTAQRNIIANILRQANIVMKDTPPKRERDVQDGLFHVLRLAFPGCVREPPIKQATKFYMPEFGIETIQTAVEVKYVDEANKVGTVLGELYEDMKGYSGDHHWTHFFGIIYQTEAFTSQDIVNAECQKVGIPKGWEVFVVLGPGQEKAKKGGQALEC